MLSAGHLTEAKTSFAVLSAIQRLRGGQPSPTSTQHALRLLVAPPKYSGRLASSSCARQVFSNQEVTSPVATQTGAKHGRSNFHSAVIAGEMSMTIVRGADKFMCHS